MIVVFLLLLLKLLVNSLFRSWTELMPVLSTGHLFHQSIREECWLVEESLCLDLFLGVWWSHLFLTRSYLVDCQVLTAVDSQTSVLLVNGQVFKTFAEDRVVQLLVVLDCFGSAKVLVDVPSLSLEALDFWGYGRLFTFIFFIWFLFETRFHNVVKAEIFTCSVHQLFKTRNKALRFLC